MTLITKLEEQDFDFGILYNLMQKNIGLTNKRNENNDIKMQINQLIISLGLHFMFL